MAWITIVSTLSGENLSLCRDNECERPTVICRIAAAETSGTRDSSWPRTPRRTSRAPSWAMHSMPSFSLMMPPNLASETINESPSSLSTTFFLRNFLRDLSSLPSICTSARESQSSGTWWL